MFKKRCSKIFLLVLICAIGLICVSFFMPQLNPFHTDKQQGKIYRIAIASSPLKHRSSINSIAVQVLKDLSSEYHFEFIQIESSDNFEWVYNVGEIHEKDPLDLLIGVGWEASEFFPLIHSRYEDLQYVILDNKIPFPFAKSVYFSRYDCAFIMGAMLATAFPNEKIFGFISNFETIYTDNYLKGFREGLQSVTPKAYISTVYTKSYDDEAIAYKLVKEQNLFGVNVLMSTLSPEAHEGVYRYAKESENTSHTLYTTCLGVDETAKDKAFIVTGITENIELALRLVINDFFHHGHNLESLKLGISDNGADVLFASTQDVNYRNTRIITDNVIKAGKHALQYIEDKNKKRESKDTVQIDRENQIIIRGTLLNAK